MNLKSRQIRAINKTIDLLYKEYEWGKGHMWNGFTCPLCRKFYERACSGCPLSIWDDDEAGCCELVWLFKRKESGKWTKQDFIPDMIAALMEIRDYGLDYINSVGVQDET